jgi:4-amino-4-deoxychorismate lyase
MLAVLVDGQASIDPNRAIAVSDRGLAYGDGLFETMLLDRGKVRFLDAHLRRLAEGCRRLGIAYPGDEILKSEIASICGSHAAGVVKLILTRGAGARGYRPALGTPSTRIVSLHEAVESPSAIRVRWCDMRLARNAALAGIKHLNRLEQVLAQAEWQDPDIAEGFMLDSEGELVCATSANVFIVRGRELLTHDLRYCGVRGIMRGEVIRLAKELGMSVREEPLRPEDLESATEVFVTNAVRGIRSVTALERFSWPCGEVARSLREALQRDA